MESPSEGVCHALQLVAAGAAEVRASFGVKDTDYVFAPQNEGVRDEEVVEISRDLLYQEEVVNGGSGFYRRIVNPVIVSAGKLRSLLRICSVSIGKTALRLAVHMDCAKTLPAAWPSYGALRKCRSRKEKKRSPEQ